MTKPQASEIQIEIKVKIIKIWLIMVYPLEVFIHSMINHRIGNKQNYKAQGKEETNPQGKPKKYICQSHRFLLIFHNNIRL